MCPGRLGLIDFVAAQNASQVAGRSAIVHWTARKSQPETDEEIDKVTPLSCPLHSRKTEILRKWQSCFLRSKCNLCRYFTRFSLSGRPCMVSTPTTHFASSCVLFSSLVSPGLTYQGGNGTRYRLVRPLGMQIRGKQPHVWLAVDASNDAVEYVVKRPSDIESNAGETPSASLHMFKHELAAQRLFQKRSHDSGACGLHP